MNINHCLLSLLLIFSVIYPITAWYHTEYYPVIFHNCQFLLLLINLILKLMKSWPNQSTQNSDQTVRMLQIVVSLKIATDWTWYFMKSILPVIRSKVIYLWTWNVFLIHRSSSVKAKSFQMKLLGRDVCSLLLNALLRASAPCWFPRRHRKNRVWDNLRYSKQSTGIVRGNSWPLSWFVQQFIIHSPPPDQDLSHSFQKAL